MGSYLLASKTTRKESAINTFSNNNNHYNNYVKTEILFFGILLHMNPMYTKYLYVLFIFILHL